MIMFDNKTVSKYIDSLVESYLFYRVKRSPRFGFSTYIVGKKVRTKEGFTQYIQEPQTVQHPTTLENKPLFMTL